MITTDMSNAEIMDYAWEFIPMLKDLKIQGQRIPFEGNERQVVKTYEDGTTDYMIAPGNMETTRQKLHEAIGMTPAEAVN